MSLATIYFVCNRAPQTHSVAIVGRVKCQLLLARVR